MKPIMDFVKHPECTQGVTNECKTCRNARNKSRPNPTSARRAYLKYRYQITPEDYAAMFQAQGGVCAISGKACVRGEWLVVDHYDSPEGLPIVRGLLTRVINAAIGLFDHNPTTLRAAADYLEKHGYAH